MSLLAILASGPHPASAQGILVEVVEAETQQPIPTAFLTLVNEEDTPLGMGLTDPNGRLLFLLPGAGTYRVRAEMFTRGTEWSPPMRVEGTENVPHRFELAFEAINLPGIRVESERQCRIRPEDGQELARVWEEARKALSIQNWTDRMQQYRFQVVGYERVLDRRARDILKETRNEVVTLMQNPIQSLPAPELLNGGFIRVLTDESWEFNGPDAAVLLSDLFLGSHCFRLREERDLPGWIGLAFEPVRDDDVPDIEGTLWLDRATAHLGFMEFDYLNAPSPLNWGDASGRIEFERLPTGAWIIRKWWIRTPRMAPRGRGRGWTVSGVLETGGEIVGITPIGSPNPSGLSVPSGSR